MNHKFLQVLTIASSAALTGAYVYFASKPELRPALAPLTVEVTHTVEVTNTVELDKPGLAGPAFSADLDMIPSTKSFRLMPPDTSASNPPPKTNQSAHPVRKSEQAIIDALQLKSDFSIQQKSLREIAVAFSAQYKIPIAFDESTRVEQIVARDEPISLDLSAVSLRTALNRILEPRELTYIVKNDVLLIAARHRDMVMGTKSGVIDLGDAFSMPSVQSDTRDTKPTDKPISK